MKGVNKGQGNGARVTNIRMRKIPQLFQTMGSEESSEIQSYLCSLPHPCPQFIRMDTGLLGISVHK